VLHLIFQSFYFVADIVPSIVQGGNLATDTVAKACRRFQTRIEAVVEANDNFLE
jgi:hypothetical protein